MTNDLPSANLSHMLGISKQRRQPKEITETVHYSTEEIIGLYKELLNNGIYALHLGEDWIRNLFEYALALEGKKYDLSDVEWEEVYKANFEYNKEMCEGKPDGEK